MILKAENLSRRYARHAAVDAVSFELEEGHTYALLGPNGSGKTTLMKMIAGLTHPTSGTLEFEGRRIGAAAKADIAYMPTENYFYNYMTLWDAGRYYADFFRDFSLERYAAMLDRMELDRKARTNTLSSGMSAKVRLALTLSRDAKLLMLDEPLNGVDMLTRAQVVNEIVGRRDEGRTMLISTHLVDELETHIDDAIYMKDGKIVRMGSRAALNAEGTLTELYLKIYGKADA